MSEEELVFKAVGTTPGIRSSRNGRRVLQLLQLFADRDDSLAEEQVARPARSTGLVAALLLCGAGDQTTMDIAAHVSRQMLARYSHIRMEAKRKVLESIGTKLLAPARVGEEATPITIQ